MHRTFRGTSFTVLAVVLTLMTGCDSRDERLEKLASESLDRQAAQNEQIARQSQTTAETTRQLVEADADSRKGFIDLQKDVQAERTSLNRQYESLEGERKELAAQRRRESFLGPLISSSVGLIIAALPLVICLILLIRLFRERPDEELGEILLQELVAEKPLLLPPAGKSAVSWIEEGARLTNQTVAALPAATDDQSRLSKKVLIVVEGHHDVSFLKQIGTVLHRQEPGLPNLAQLESEGRVIFVPTGGGDLRQWTVRFSGLGHREFHLYDREVAPLTEERHAAVAAVNQRDGCRAVLTRKRAIENYLHPVVVREALEIDVTFGDFEDVAEVVARATLQSRGSSSWDEIPGRGRRKLRERAKLRLHRHAVPRMTPELLAERDPDGEVQGWLTAIDRLLGP